MSGMLGEPAQFGEVVRNLLLVGEVVTELGEDTGGHRDVTGLDVDAGGLGEGPDDRQEGVRRKQRRLVGQRVDDGRLRRSACAVWSRRRYVGRLSVSLRNKRYVNPLACIACGGIPFESVMSASIKPRRWPATLQPRWGAPGDDQVEQLKPAARQSAGPPCRAPERDRET